MPGPTQPERGLKSPYNARYRVTIGPCSGLDLSQDISTIDDTALVDAINCRVHDGIVVSRGGQETTASGMDGCIQGLVDIEGFGARFAVAEIDDADENTNVGFVDESNGTFISMENVLVEYPRKMNVNGEFYDYDLQRYVYGNWQGYVIFQETNGNPVDSYQLMKIVVPDNLSDIDKIQFEVLVRLQVPGEANPFTVSSFLTMPGAQNEGSALFMGTKDGGVVVWDGNQLYRILADSTFSGRVILFSYNGRVYAAGYDSKILYQTNGWTDAGSIFNSGWSQVAFPAGPAEFVPMCGVQHENVAYVGGYDPVDAGNFPASNSGYIIKIDDSSGSPVATIALNAKSTDFLQSVDQIITGPPDGAGNTIWITARWVTGGGTMFADVAIWNGGTSYPTTIIHSVGESGAGSPRIVSAGNKVYFSDFADASGPGFYSWKAGVGVVAILTSTRFHDIALL